MTLHKEALKVLERLLPGLIDQLKAIPFSEREDKGSLPLSLFKEKSGPALLINKKQGGQGISAKDAVLLQMGLGSLSPSLAISVGMHQFSIASLITMAKQGTGMESLLLEGIAKNNLLVSSAFSEGKVSRSILTSSIIAKPYKKGFKISGKKKPCSMAHDMDLLTASVIVKSDDREPYLAVAMIHKDCEGVSVEDFWQRDFLKAAQNESIVLDEVYVPASMVVNIDESYAYQAQIKGFVWFELLTSASYLGMVSALFDYAHTKNRLPPEQLASYTMTLEAMGMMLKSVCHEIEEGLSDIEIMPRILSVRYHMQTMLSKLSNDIIALIGGIAYITDSLPSYIVATIQAFNFHPPSKWSMTNSFGEWVNDQPFKIV